MKARCRNCRCAIEAYYPYSYGFCSESCQREFEVEEAEYRYQQAQDDKLEKSWEEEE
jgi:hypothetical protein